MEYLLSTEFLFIWLESNPFSFCFFIWVNAFWSLFYVSSSYFLVWSRWSSTLVILSVTKASSICSLNIFSLLSSSIWLNFYRWLSRSLCNFNLSLLYFNLISSTSFLNNSVFWDIFIYNSFIFDYAISNFCLLNILSF